MKKIAGIVYITLIVLVIFTGCSSAAEKARYWERFNPGSWVLYELPDGLQKKVSLVNKTDAQITLKVEMIKQADIVGSSEEKILLDLDTESETPVKPDMLEYVQDTLVVNQVMACKVYEHDTGKELQKLWFSDQIPGGLVQSALEGSLTLKLIDYEAKYYVK
ncbi:MAG: hypothetical protein ISS32_02715 [Candidatus Omnitrophica bacterium]|nr:hypothetical protein [Candidatus Omnitrophota bacterium]MBL7210678.1 hypothetical protein [Candidatus Omnitrophota bacterium]